MPTYEWKNTETGEYVEVERRVTDASVPPDLPGTWVRSIRSAPCVPFERMRENGVFERLPQTSLRKPT